ncbi:c-type cytochrome [Lentibacter sp. XHP0401]|uniref:c-type cytochrome n=1 Tax=Lentibacter sp. XHP0401 TaxID=2984334 RepID=UPI0021E93703|nr:c-type cytochrome [Lentibacter sp. XHP0401]MCV2893912.1 c-type cytochrome [Lentibacter sp. XHP0401]
MSKYLKLTVAALALVAASPAAAEKFGLGRVATDAEVAAWDLDVHPDGSGLPEGSGDVWTGETVFADNCAVCHGDFAEGVGNWPKLAGGMGTLDRKDPLKTVGSYWPYLSTTWDYVNRSMPFGNAQTLTPDEVYAITAYILFSNDLVDDDFVLSKETFLDVEMPNADGFILDDRLTSEAHFVREPCMENCKGEVKITKNVVFKGDPNSPDDPEAEPAAQEAVAEEAVEEKAAAEPVAEEAVVTEAALDMDLVAEGEKVFKQCKACHQVGEGAKNRTGPILNGVVGAALGHRDDFKYSKTMAEMGEEGVIWDEANLATYLAKPRAFVNKTRMSFAGLKKEEDIAAVTEYLKSFPE